MFIFWQKNYNCILNDDTKREATAWHLILSSILIITFFHNLNHFKEMFSLLNIITEDLYTL